PWVRPVLDFAHLHAVTDGGFVETEPFAGVLELADRVQEPGSAFHIHFSDIAYANRNETKHLPYGEGTLRADPLRKALRQFKRPATVISESPDETSHQAIREAIVSSSARRASTAAASSSRPRSEAPQRPDRLAAELRGPFGLVLLEGEEAEPALGMAQRRRRAHLARRHPNFLIALCRPVELAAHLVQKPESHRGVRLRADAS